MESSTLMINTKINYINSRLKEESENTGSQWPWISNPGPLTSATTEL